MNKGFFMGRLCKDPDIRFSNNQNSTCVAKFNLAVDRRFKREGEPDADFFQIVAFGKLGEFAEKYLHKGTKVVIEYEVRNNNYTNSDGQKVYGFQFIANSIEFAESKRTSEENTFQNQDAPQDKLMPAPDQLIEELPFA